MVVGELLNNGALAEVRAMKIQDLSSDKLAPTAWPLEVEDSRRYVMDELASQ